jgi:hypothetical protein
VYGSCSTAQPLRLSSWITQEEPVSEIRLRPAVRKAATWYLGAWSLGAVLVFAAVDPRLTGFGLGLMAPGAGLAYHGHWAALAVFVAAAVFAVRQRGFGVLAWAWFALALLMLTHGPHPGEGWPAAQWVVPAATIPVAVVGAVVAVGISLPRVSSERR